MMNHKRRFGSGNFMHSFGLSYQEGWLGLRLARDCVGGWRISRTWQDTTCRARHFVKCPRNILITKIGRKWRIGVCLGVRTWIVHKILEYPSSMGMGLDFPGIQNRTFPSKIHEKFILKMVRIRYFRMKIVYFELKFVIAKNSVIFFEFLIAKIGFGDFSSTFNWLMIDNIDR